MRALPVPNYAGPTENAAETETHRDAHATSRVDAPSTGRGECGDTPPLTQNDARGAGPKRLHFRRRVSQTVLARSPKMTSQNSHGAPFTQACVVEQICLGFCAHPFRESKASARSSG